jgi:hypothetical protein
VGGQRIDADQAQLIDVDGCLVVNPVLAVQNAIAPVTGLISQRCS